MELEHVKYPADDSGSDEADDLEAATRALLDVQPSRYSRRIDSAGIWAAPLLWIGGCLASAARGWPSSAPWVIAAMAGAWAWWKLRRWWVARNAPRPAPPADIELAQLEWDLWCQKGGITPPIVVNTWTTDTGHGYLLNVTHDGAIDRNGKPMSVHTWCKMGSYLRDLVGWNCTYVKPIAVRGHGGHSITYVNLRARQAAKVAATITIGGETHQFYDQDELDAAVDSYYGNADEPADTEETPDQEPANNRPQAPIAPAYSVPTAPIEDEQGSGVALPPPTGPARAPTLYPPGLDQDHREAFDMLRQMPVGRAAIALKLGLPATSASRLLDGWKDARWIEQTAGLWIASPDYRRSSSITPDGDEEGPRSATVDG